MAGIDNNTVLYLRGDSFTDLSSYNLSVINNDAIIADNVIDCSNGKTFKITNNEKFNFKDTGFTIEFNIMILKTFSAWGKVFDKGGVAGRNITQYKLEYYASNYRFCLGDGETDGYIGIVSLPESNIGLNVWKHIELSYNCHLNKIYLFVDGKLFKTADISNKPQNLSASSDITIGYQENEPLPVSFKLSNFRISNICRHTEDFTPPTKPYNSITINKTNQTDTNIEFNIEKLGQETINKVEVLVNGTVSKTYTNSYNNIDYLIDKSLCAIGKNNITIRVTYDDTYTEELLLTHKVAIDKLPLETPLLDTVERVKLLTKSKQNEKNMLSNILTSKNVEVTEEDKMSDLIGKVDILDKYDDGKLWLYKDGNEYNNITGGFSSYGQVNTNIEINKYPLYMEIKNISTITTGNLGGFSSNNLIDTTGYNKLYIEVDLTAGSELGANAHILYVQTSKNQSSFSANTRVEIVGKNITSLDVSSFSKVYIGCWITYKNTVMKVTKLWLEK